MDLLAVAIITQVNFYFSAQNLNRDVHLRGLMHPITGWVALSEIVTFKRMVSMGATHIPTVARALRHSTVVEIDPSDRFVRARPYPTHFLPPPFIHPQSSARAVSFAVQFVPMPTPHGFVNLPVATPPFINATGAQFAADTPCNQEMKNARLPHGKVPVKSSTADLHPQMTYTPLKPTGHAFADSQDAHTHPPQLGTTPLSFMTPFADAPSGMASQPTMHAAPQAQRQTPDPLMPSMATTPTGQVKVAQTPPPPISANRRSSAAQPSRTLNASQSMQVASMANRSKGKDPTEIGGTVRVGATKARMGAGVVYGAAALAMSTRGAAVAAEGGRTEKTEKMVKTEKATKTTKATKATKTEGWSARGGGLMFGSLPVVIPLAELEGGLWGKGVGGIGVRDKRRAEDKCREEIMRVIDEKEIGSEVSRTPSPPKSRVAREKSREHGAERYGMGRKGRCLSSLSTDTLSEDRLSQGRVGEGKSRRWQVGEKHSARKREAWVDKRDGRKLEGVRTKMSVWEMNFPPLSQAGAGSEVQKNWSCERKRVGRRSYKEVVRTL